MSAFGKSLTAVFAGLALVVASVAVASAQAPWMAPASEKGKKNPVKGIGNAKKLVETNCVSCHGTSGHGDGPAAAALPPPKPANWTSERVRKETDGELFWKISNGRGAMPPWKDALKENERWEIINYLRTLKGK